MIKKTFFITGTDTDVGKTWATVALMRYFKRQGKTVVGMKPVAAGCERLQGELRNTDALLLQSNSSVQLAYKEVNPHAFELPVSPHLSGLENQVELDLVIQSYDNLKNKAEVILVEGAGGWFSPINNEEDNADLAKKLNIPVIMIVGIKLGCINHARLTFQAIKGSGVKCCGWFAICLDQEMAMQDENIETIKNKISAPLLGVLPYSNEMDFDLLATKIHGDL